MSDQWSVDSDQPVAGEHASKVGLLQEFVGGDSLESARTVEKGEQTVT